MRWRRRHKLRRLVSSEKSIGKKDTFNDNDLASRETRGAYAAPRFRDNVLAEETKYIRPDKHTHKQTRIHSKKVWPRSTRTLSEATR